jgi:hypothetical protein
MKLEALKPNTTIHETIWYIDQQKTAIRTTNFILIKKKKEPQILC